MENPLKSLRPQLERVKLSLLRRLPAMQELYDKVEFVLAIPADTAALTDEQKSIISSLKKDVQAYIRERAAKAGVTEDLSVHIQRIRESNEALFEFLNKASWNSSNLEDILPILNGLKSSLSNMALSYPQTQASVKSLLECLKQAITSCSDKNPSANTVQSIREMCASLVAMSDYLVSYLLAQESFIKKGAIGAST